VEKICQIVNSVIFISFLASTYQLQPLENPQLLTQIPPSSAPNACTPQSL
jgi:hypothetical protein